jgi:hypothetical protein
MLLLRNENVSRDIVEDTKTGKLNVFYQSCMDLNTINGYDFKDVLAFDC